MQRKFNVCFVANTNLEVFVFLPTRTSENRQHPCLHYQAVRQPQHSHTRDKSTGRRTHNRQLICFVCAECQCWLPQQNVEPGTKRHDDKTTPCTTPSEFESHSKQKPYHLSKVQWVDLLYSCLPPL
eukprot:3706646-Amphidinium_carterae.1